MNLHLRTILIAALVGCSFWGVAAPRAASARSDGAFQVTANPEGGTILTGTVGSSSLAAETATLMRGGHAQIGSVGGKK